MKIHTEIRPHSTDQKLLQKSASIYHKGKTPEIDAYGNLSELDIAPGGPAVAAQHLHQIYSSFGYDGVRKTIQGLQITRGNQFVLQMVESDGEARQLFANAQPASVPSTLPTPVVRALSSSSAGAPLPTRERTLFAKVTGKDPRDVQVHNDRDSHEAAAAIGAKAFTVGRHIFFGQAQYDLQSAAGRTLLAHEVVHTYQQHNASMPALTSLRISSPHDHHENQADRLAKSITDSVHNRAGNDEEVVNDQVAAQESAVPGQINVAQIQRAISFTTTDGAITTNNMSTDIQPGGFVLQSIGAPGTPTFQWNPTVTIHGTAADVFTDWETAHHQVGTFYRHHVNWGEGVGRTSRQGRVRGGLPARDSYNAAHIWYYDPFARGFTNDNETRSPHFEDSPQTALIPWEAPLGAVRYRSGSFDYGLRFSSTLSAHHIPTGNVPAAFRHLKHVNWDFDVTGTFDANRPQGPRVTIVRGGPINHTQVLNGADNANPPMHGGGIMNDIAYNDTMGPSLR